MTDMTEQSLQTRPQLSDLEPAFKRIVIIAVMFTFAVMMLFFSFALAKDVNLLRNAPGMVWAFICGAPNPDGPALPLMLTITTLSFLGGMGATGWHLWMNRKERQQAT